MRGGNWGGRGERIDFANLQVRFRQSRLMSLHCNLQRVLSVLLQSGNAGEGTDTLCEDNHPQNLDGIGVFSLVCSDKEILLA